MPQRSMSINPSEKHYFLLSRRCRGQL